MRVELCHAPKAFTRDEVLAQLSGVREIMQRHGARLAYLFGSVLHDAPRPLADLDIAVLPDLATYDWLRTYTDLYDDLCKLFQADNIDVLMLNEAPLPFRFAVVRDGLLVWAPDDREALAFAEATVTTYNDTAHWRREHWAYLCRRIEEGLSVAMRDVDPERVRFLLGRMKEDGK